MPKIKKSETKSKFIQTVGRRKEAIARVRLYLPAGRQVLGKGESIVNNQPISQYFPGETARVIYFRPFEETGTRSKYYVTAKITGGGKTGQLEAFVHGVARALALTDRENFRPLLKKQGFLTRDARIRERRKVGTGGKARRKKQSPKR